MRLFGLMLFGPIFLAAHRADLFPREPTAYEIDLAEPTHPPYAVRHKMLVQAVRLLRWHRPITNRSDGHIYKAETQLLDYILEDAYPPWASVFDDVQIDEAIKCIRQFFGRHKRLAYVPIDRESLVGLIERLSRGLPPVLAEIDCEGEPKPMDVAISQTLYAGWVFWEGRSCFVTDFEPNFTVINRLCSHALFQQRAIAVAKAS